MAIGTRPQCGAVLAVAAVSGKRDEKLNYSSR